MFGFVTDTVVNQPNNMMPDNHLFPAGPSLQCGIVFVFNSPNRTGPLLMIKNKKLEYQTE